MSIIRKGQPVAFKKAVVDQIMQEHGPKVVRLTGNKIRPLEDFEFRPVLPSAASAPSAVKSSAFTFVLPLCVLSFFLWTGVVVGPLLGHVAVRTRVLTAILADTIPSSAEEFKVIGFVGGGIIIGAALVAASRYLFPSGDKARGTSIDHLAVLEKRFQDYQREANHAIKDGLQAIMITGQEREERLSDRLDQQDVKWNDSVRHVHTRIEATQQTTREEFDSKLTEVRRELIAMPDRVVALLRQTNANFTKGTRS